MKLLLFLCTFDMMGFYQGYVKNQVIGSSKFSNLRFFIERFHSYFIDFLHFTVEEYKCQRVILWECAFDEIAV